MALYTVHHSASAHVCTRTRFGDRAFAVAGTKVWNVPPAQLCQSDIEPGRFERLLKTFLFQ